MFCTSSHILGETCECSAPLSTYWHGHANIMHLSAHIRKSMPIYCSTWHIFTGLSEYIRRSIPMFCYYWHGIAPRCVSFVSRTVATGNFDDKSNPESVGHRCCSFCDNICTCHICVQNHSDEPMPDKDCEFNLEQNYTAI